MLKSAIMKRLSLVTMVWCLCIAVTTALTGCEPTFVDPCEEQTNNRILRFREYCYDASGNVKLNHQEGNGETEWVIPIATDEAFHQVFNQLTGLSVHPAETLEYSYHSEDHRYVCRLVGSAKAKSNRYASLYLWIEGCPEIEVIHFVRKR